MKNTLKVLMLGVALLALPVLSQAKPLRVAIKPYSPPFIMQAGNKQFFGFDVGIANYLCNYLKRPCEFVVMPFSQILPSVQRGQVDIGMSAITITAARATRVNFTLPYMLSYTRFIGPKADLNKPFSLALLNGKTIGIEEGTIFGEEIQILGIQNAIIKPFKDLHELINAVATGTVNYALIDDPGDVYDNFLSANFGDKVAALGKPILYGAGLGVAVNPADPDLLADLNQAMRNYTSSNSFIQDYNAYIGQKY